MFEEKKVIVSSVFIVMLVLSLGMVSAFDFSFDDMWNKWFGGEEVSFSPPNSVGNGYECISASECSSGYCYPGPDEKNYCIAREKNCAKPGTEGIMFGESYDYGDHGYECKLGDGLVFEEGSESEPNLPEDEVLEEVITSDCGLTLEQIEEIKKIYEDEWRPVMVDRLNDYPRNYTRVLYDLQIQTANLAIMANYCEEEDLLDSLAELYILPFEYIDSIGTTGEDMLDSTQYSYALAYLSSAIASYSEYHGPTQTMVDYQSAVVPFMANTLERWITQKSMWMWQQCGLPYNVESYLKAYTLSEYVNKKANNELGFLEGAPSYCDAVLEIELWTGAGATELLSGNTKNPSMVPLSSNQISIFSQYSKDVMKLFESRISSGAQSSIQFDLGAWDDHPDYPSENWKDKGVQTVWDFSHARRFVQFSESMYGNTAISKPSLNGDAVITGFSNALMNLMYNDNSDDPAFTNFMNGINTQYLAYYPPFKLSKSYYEGGYGFWSRYNSEINQLNEILYSAYKQDKEFTYMPISRTYDKFNFIASMSKPSRPKIEFVKNGNICSTNDQCSSGYCYPGPGNKNYCIAREKNCAKPSVNGVMFGESYEHNGDLFICVSTGLKLNNGELCSSSSECSSGYCYPGPGNKNYCIAREKNCAKPGTEGIMFGESYDYLGEAYECKSNVGLIFEIEGGIYYLDGKVYDGEGNSLGGSSVELTDAINLFIQGSITSEELREAIRDWISGGL